MLTNFGKAFLLLIIAFVPMSEHTFAKSLQQDEIQYRRLSIDVLADDPLFDVVAAGTPTGNFVALLSQNYEACILEVINAHDNKVVLSVADHLSCAEDYEFEDGHAINNALQFRGFLGNNFKLLKPVLTRYKIDFNKLPDPTISPKRDKDGDSQCVKLAALRICKSKNKRVLVDKLSE